jgi:hypothetical protein
VIPYINRLQHGIRFQLVLKVECPLFHIRSGTPPFYDIDGKAEQALVS